jgi:hypothetical protein
MSRAVPDGRPTTTVLQTPRWSEGGRLMCLVGVSRRTGRPLSAPCPTNSHPGIQFALRVRWPRLVLG